MTTAAMYQVGSKMKNGSLSVFILSNAFVTKANSALLTELFNYVMSWSTFQNNTLLKLSKLLCSLNLKRLVGFQLTLAPLSFRDDR